MAKWKINEQWLRELVEKTNRATPGPWISLLEGRDVESGESFIQTTRGDFYIEGATDDDLEFIAAARTALPRLIDEVDRLRKQLGEKGA